MHIFFYDKRHWQVYFSVMMFKLTLNVNINPYCVRVTRPWIAHLSHFPHKLILHLCSLVPTCDPRDEASFDPKGHHMNEIDKGLQGDATYQKSKLYPFRFQRRRILKLFFFIPMFQLVTPGVGSVLTPKESYE